MDIHLLCIISNVKISSSHDNSKFIPPLIIFIISDKSKGKMQNFQPAPPSFISRKNSTGLILKIAGSLNLAIERKRRRRTAPAGEEEERRRRCIWEEGGREDEGGGHHGDGREDEVKFGSWGEKKISTAALVKRLEVGRR